MNKPSIWFILAVTALFWVVNKFRTTVARTAPVGYEDDAGFHFGQPVED